MGGAAGVEVRQSRGAHFRLVFVTISGNISNLKNEIIDMSTHNETSQIRFRVCMHCDGGFIKLT